MAYVEQGQIGAFRATWRKGNPRSLLRTLIGRNPRSGQEKIHELFWQEIEDDKELLRACVEYWLDNNYRSLMNEQPEIKAKNASERVNAIARTAEKIKDHIEHKARIALLALTMPNDKKLADCNKTECLKSGGWLTKVGNRLPRNKTVGQVFNEDDLHALFNP
jgi:hypothetical protein